MKLKILFDSGSLTFNNIIDTTSIDTLKVFANLILNATNFKEVKSLSVTRSEASEEIIFIQSVELNHKESKLRNKATLQLEANIIPNNHNKKITWESSNTKYVTVSDSGLVTSKSNNGNSTITVTCGGVSDTCYIICSNKSLLEGEEEEE